MTILAFVRAPFFQALDELRAFCLGEHEIAGAKLSDLAILKRAAEIFRTIVSIQPSLIWMCAFRNSVRFDHR